MDLKKIRCTLLMFALLPLSVNAQAPTEEDDDILLLVPPIVAGSAGPTEIIPPVWTVVNEVCCTNGGSVTYSATIDGQTRASRLASCTALEPSVPDVAESTEGDKNVRSGLNSLSCGRLDFPTLRFPFENSTLYIFQAVFNQNNNSVEVNVLSGELTPENQTALNGEAQMRRFVESGKANLLQTKSVSIESVEVDSEKLKSSGEPRGKFQSRSK